MSYRAFKRLLGETSLERKCHFLFGAFILLMITGSFWLYARRTEYLAYDQIVTSCRLLVVQIVDRQIATGCREKPARAQGADAKGPPLPSDRPKGAVTQTEQALTEFSKRWEEHWPEALKQYRFSTYLMPPRTDRPPDHATLERMKEFEADESSHEENQLLVAHGKNIYYAAVRATPSCLGCHRRLQPDRDLKEKGLLAVIKIEVDTDAALDSLAGNRALLITMALVTSLLIMGGSYVIVRYVIVKPVKHLKEVSDAISAGELNVRSEIQTGDEFEDLSHAFNRMLRNLVAVQERLRKVNNDLDRKVDELAQANLALYDSNRLKSEFLATMSHELRTPLHSILGFGEVLGSSAGLTEKQLRWVRNIRSSGEQLMALIGDILDLAKIEAGKMQVSLDTFDAADVCEGLLAMFRPMAEKKNIDLRGVFTPGMPKLRQDMVKMQQILNNLLSNAVKFTPEGGRVVLKADVEGPFIVLTVQDTGVGIAPEEQELVFEKFRQAAGNLMTREHGGTGLGLSIVRELSKLLGGEVTLQSELGRGSTFTVRLPLQLSEEPKLEFDLALEGIDLSKAQRIDVRLYTGAPPIDGPHPLVPAPDAPSERPTNGQEGGEPEPAAAPQAGE
jgi:signal transduction histidine kinase